MPRRSEEIAERLLMNGYYARQIVGGGVTDQASSSFGDPNRATVYRVSWHHEELPIG
jgi:hypothetical protein